MRNPLVSVVMSVFNGQTFLSEAVESILHQSFQDFEFVVIDDGSTDGTVDILSTFAKRDKRVRVVRQHNQGRPKSLNDGIGFASGRYIARMDADDIAFPNRLETQIDFMEQNPEVGLLGGAFERINSAGQTIDIIRPPLEDSQIRSIMERYNPMCHPAVLMRRDLVVATGGYRKPLLDADDYDLWLRLAERSKLANLDQVILRYRIHPNQVSVKNARHQVLCVLAARAAASLRRSGRPDPLSNIEEITSELVGTMGVSDSEQGELLVSGYAYWMHALRRSDPEAALPMVEEIWSLSASGFVTRPTLADALLIAADIHRKQGRPLKALVWGARALRARPIVAGRFVRDALRRLAGIVNRLLRMKD
jgi:hypothetical protein